MNGPQLDFGHHTVLQKEEKAVGYEMLCTYAYLIISNYGWVHNRIIMGQL